MKDSINVSNLVERCMPNDFPTPSHTNIMNDEVMAELKLLFDNKYTNLAKKTVALLDDDHDGKLNISEIAGMYPVERCMNSNSYLRNEIHAAEMVSALDRDGDHKLSVQELARGIRIAESPALGVLGELDEWDSLKDKTQHRIPELPITINPIWTEVPDPIWNRHPKITLYKNDELPKLILE